MNDNSSWTSEATKEILIGGGLILLLASAGAAFLEFVDKPATEYLNNYKSEELYASQRGEVEARLKHFIAERNGTPMQSETLTSKATRYEFDVSKAFVAASYDGDMNNCPRFKIVLKPKSSGNYQAAQSLTVCLK